MLRPQVETIMHYYQFNIGDYASHTQHLDPLEDIAYRRMLDWIYVNEKPLPNNINQIAKYNRMRDECERITDVLQEYFKLTEYGYTQQRVEKEIAHYKNKSEKAKKAIEARWAKNRNKSDTDVLQTNNERNTKQETLNTKQETLNNNSKETCATGVAPNRVIEIYNEFFSGTNAALKRLPTDSLKQSIRHRKNVLEDEEDWLAYFGKVKSIPFLMGLTQSRDRRPFKLTIDWLVKPANLAKVTEGFYDG